MAAVKKTARLPQNICAPPCGGPASSGPGVRFWTANQNVEIARALSTRTHAPPPTNSRSNAARMIFLPRRMTSCKSDVCPCRLLSARKLAKRESRKRLRGSLANPKRMAGRCQRFVRKRNTAWIYRHISEI